MSGPNGLPEHAAADSSNCLPQLDTRYLRALSVRTSSAKLRGLARSKGTTACGPSHGPPAEPVELATMHRVSPSARNLAHAARFRRDVLRQVRRNSVYQYLR